MANAKRTKTTVETPRAGRQPWAIAAAASLTVVGLIAYLLLRRPGAAELARSVPANVSVFVEFPSARHVIEGLAALRIVDATSVDSKHAATEVTDAIAEAYHLDGQAAEALASSVIGAALVARPELKGRPSAWLVRVSSDGGVEALLAKSRFASKGHIGEGQAFAVAPEGSDSGDLLARGLRALPPSGATQRVVWFAKAKLLAGGDEPLLREIAAVVDTGSASLADQAPYQQARAHAPRGAEGTAYVNLGALKDASLTPGWKAFVDGYMHDGGTAMGSVRLTSAGLLIGAEAALSGPAVPPNSIVIPGEASSYLDRLPKETGAFVVGSLKRAIKPAEARAQLRKSLEALQFGFANDFAEELTALEEEAGLSVDDVFEMAGDDAALILLIDKDFKYGPSPLFEAALRGAGLIFAMKVDSDAAARRVLAKVRDAFEHSKLASLAQVTPDETGFAVTVTSKASILIGGPPPMMRVTYTKKEIRVVVAPPPLALRAMSALDGNGATLKDDPAFGLAIKALRPNARVYAWADLGRVAALAYAASPEAKGSAQARGMPVDALHLTGPDRVTLAFDVDYETKEGAAKLDVESLNLWSLGLIASFQPVPNRHRGPSGTPTLASGAPVPSASAPVDPRPFYPHALDDMPRCQEYLDRLQACAEKADDTEKRTKFEQLAATKRAGYLRYVPADRQFTDKECVLSLYKLNLDPDCK